MKVSFDRPFYVGGGTADLGNYEVPFIRWAEREGWDVAHCMDIDLHANPSIAMGRKALVLLGHQEYWSRGCSTRRSPRATRAFTCCRSAATP